MAWKELCLPPTLAIPGMGRLASEKVSGSELARVRLAKCVHLSGGDDDTVHLAAVNRSYIDRFWLLRDKPTQAQSGAPPSPNVAVSVSSRRRTKLFPNSS